MTPMESSERYSRLELTFIDVLDSPAGERDGLLRRLAETDPDLAREARELLRVHEGQVPALDVAQVPTIDPNRNACSMIGAVVDGWKIIRHIGRGGWADVYEAHQAVPVRACALKVLRWPWLCTPRALRRFRDEAELLARVEHVGIARVYGAGVSMAAGAELPYLAMELVPDATPITRYVDRRGLSVNQKLRLFEEVCDAVHSAHRRGVLHRDLKPSNVLVGSDGRTRVIDFGVAYAVDHAGQSLTCTGEFIGTVGYMSPERLLGRTQQGRAAGGGPSGASHSCRGGERGGGDGEDGGDGESAGSGGGDEPPDARWDVYSLGVILYEMLTGSSPYSLPSNVASAVALLQRGAPVAPKAAAPSLARDVCTILEAAIERDPVRRYQSVAELGADVHRYLTNRPIAARPTPVVRRVRLAARRNPALAAGVVCSLLGGVLVGATALQGWSATRKELAATEWSLNVLDDAMATARAKRTGDQVRISDLLERLERPLKDQKPLSPRVAARIHDIVGRTYEDLADYRSALEHYAAGLAAARSVWREDDALVVRLKVELAGSLYDQGDPAGAARMLEDLLAGSPKLEPEVLAKVKNDLAVAYMKAEQWDQAERVGLEAYALRVVLKGEGDAASVQTLTNLGANALRLGDLETAQERLRRAVVHAGSLGREGSRQRAHASSYLGLAQARAGDAAGSRVACRRAEDEVTRSVGRDHPLYFKLCLVWADAAAERGDLEVATELARDVERRAERVLGDADADALNFQRHASAILKHAGAGPPK